MSGEVRIPMPTDLRHEPRAKLLRLQLDEDAKSAYSSLWWKRGITNLTVETPTRPQPPTSELGTPQRAKWRTPEFIVYAFIVIAAVLIMVRTPMRLSDSEFASLFA